MEEPRFFASFVHAHGLTAGPQVHAFNHAVQVGIPGVLRDSRYALSADDGVGAHFELRFSDPVFDVGPVAEYVHPATDAVRTARLNPQDMLGAGSNATYAVPLRCNVHVRYRNVAKTMHGITIAHLPVMVGSVLCGARDDLSRLPFAEREAQQGCFVIDGQKRVVTLQKIRAYNRITRTREAQAAGAGAGAGAAEQEDAARVLGAGWTVSITSWNPAAHAEAFEAESVFALHYVPQSGDIVVRHNALHARPTVTVSLLMLALGHVWTDAEADALAREHHALGVTLGTWRESGLRTQAEALDFIANRMVNTQGHLPESRRAKAREFLRVKMLPHAQKSGALEFVRLMLRELVRCVDRECLGAEAASRFADDPDDAADEAYRGVAEEYVDAFRWGLWQLMRDAARQVHMAGGHEHQLTALALEADKRIVNSTKITACVKNWLKLGLLKVHRKQAVAGTVDRLNLKSPLASISHMRVLLSTTVARGTAARLMHETKTGFKCPYETPDGERVGLTNHLALACVPTLPPPAGLTARIWTLLARTRKGDARVFVDGDFDPGLRVHAPDAVRALQRARELGAITPETCFEINSRLGHAVMVRTSAGRLVQPLIRGEFLSTLRDGHPKSWEWGFLEAGGAVEWVDAERMFAASAETAAMVVAADPGAFRTGVHTHAQLHATCVLGVAAATLPWLDMNQAPRNTYCTGMQKQGVARALMVRGAHRGALAEHTLVNAQAPLATTLLQRLVELPKMGHGTNAVVAVNLDANNQEDGAVVCQDAVDAGMFAVVRWETNTIEVDDAHEVVLDVVQVGQPINGEDGTVLVRKWDTTTNRDTSVRAKFTGKGRVHDVMVQPQSSKRVPHARVIRIVVRRTHALQVGDKMATAHGQKFTVCRIVPRTDMPFSLQTGTVPDIVLNAHCFPTRMTGASLFDLGASKAAAVSGTRADGTPFREHEDWTEILSAHGFSRDGCERFANPATGEIMPEALNVGIMYVLVECHFSTKSFARSVGPVDALLRQPVHGRDRHGGLQFGVMEYACLEARGCAGTVYDRSVAAADGALVGVCPGCHAFTWVNEHTREAARCLWCARAAGPALKPRTVVTKHTLVLLTQELMAMGVMVRAFC